MFVNNISIFSQVQEWEWAISAGSNRMDITNDIIIDTYGNIYINGYTNDTITFDSITLYNSGNFIAKYTSSGQILWAKNSSNVINPYVDAAAVAIDINNNVFVTGVYYGDTSIFGNDTLLGKGICIFKYNFDGNLTWTKSAGNADYTEGCGSVSITKITTDDAGNLYLIGFLDGISYPTTLSIGNINLTSMNQSEDIFIAKYDSSGSALWAKTICGNGGSEADHGTSITTDINNNICITGYFNSSEISFDSAILVNSGSNDIFVAKYDLSGNLLWAKSAGGTGGDYSMAIGTDSIGNIYITGSFRSPKIIFADDTLTHTSTNGCDLFIAKYDSSGNLLWAKSATCYGDDECSDISIDSVGNAYITGYFVSSIVFDSITLTSPLATFIVKYDFLGNVLWAKTTDGGNSSNGGTSVADATNGDVYISGFFDHSEGAVIFGNDTLTNHIYPDFVLNYTDIFLAKLSNSGAYIHETEQKNSITVYPNPSNSNFMISGLPASGQIQIINSMGQTVKKADIGSHAAMSFTLTESGIYFIRVITGNESVTKKVVVCR